MTSHRLIKQFMFMTTITFLILDTFFFLFGNTVKSLSFARGSKIPTSSAIYVRSTYAGYRIVINYTYLPT